MKSKLSKLKILLIIFACTLVVMTEFWHKDHETSLDDFASLEIQSIKSIVLFYDEISIPIQNNHWPNIASKIKNMPEEFHFDSRRDVTWNQLCVLLVSVKDEKRNYVVNLGTKPTLNGSILAEIQRGNVTGGWVYGKFKGNVLVETLNEITHGKCS